MSLEYEPASEPLHNYVKGFGVEASGVAGDGLGVACLCRARREQLARFQGLSPERQFQLGVYPR
jgi:hypothetical protein